ncbi:hypothetical protein GCM10010191_52300 [Actinomadura vinacea]|uniref:Uncharacterized protein n=1 Tax=Actinomadura vinacea TaxID=115336 RepID=A0ABP5WNS0_9ACTN
MTDDMLKDVLGRIADRAEPVDGLAERALKTADRRRRTRVAGAAFALAAAVTAPVGLLQINDSPAEPPPVLNRPGKTAVELPENSPQERETARRCMRNESPRGVMGEKQPGWGKASGFRLLVRAPLGKGEYLAEVAGPRGFVLCAASGEYGNVEVPRLHFWPGQTSRGLWTFGTPFRVDAIQSVSAPKGTGTDPNRLHRIMVGRAKPGVARVRIAWDNGRTSEAAVGNGFFLGHTPNRMVPDEDATGPMSDGAMSEADLRVVSVTGYDSGGRALHTWRPQTRGEAEGFQPSDCTDALLHTRPSLCSD